MVAVMGGFYPELVAKRDHIHATIKCAPLCASRLLLVQQDGECRTPDNMM